ncbi:MAG: metal-dependent transcriptional regulator [Planctomycetota bacterium]
MARKKLTASQEDYLEAILLLVREGRVARVRDIAAHVGVGKPSVTAALKTLAKRELVNYDPYQYITLTEAGRAAAERVERRHHVIKDFLTAILGIDPETAEENACRMEHAVDQQVMQRLQAFAEFAQSCPQFDRGQWIASMDRGEACGRECET